MNNDAYDNAQLCRKFIMMMGKCGTYFFIVLQIFLAKHDQNAKIALSLVQRHELSSQKANELQ